MSFTVLNALRWWSKEQPDALALCVDGERCTFGDLYRWSAAIGAHLTALGVGAGDRVGMIGMNALDYAALAFGAMRIGAIGAPVSFRSTAHEAATAFSDLAPRVVFCDAARRDVAVAAIDGDAGRVVDFASIRPLRADAAPPPPHSPQPDDPLFIIGTSGSTARPKGVIYSHRTVVTYAAEFCISEPRCGRGSRVFSPGPFSSSSGYLLLMQFITLGATLFIESQFEPARALDILDRERITTFQAAPIFFERIAALPAFDAADLSSLYWTQVGGAAVSPALLKRWLDKGVTLRQAYGSTEAGGGWGARDDSAIAAPEKCGRGGMFTEYAIRGEDGGFAPPGVRGEILIRSACLTPGYWNNPVATQDAIRDGWLHTGDLGVMDENGVVTFVDRLKDIIISGGLNISATEVEQVIREVDGVEEVAVIAAADAQFGETPLAIVHGDTSKFDVAAILARCAERLANYKAPRFVAIESEPLPRLLSGKIAKPALRQRYRDAATRLPRVR